MLLRLAMTVVESVSFFPKRDRASAPMCGVKNKRKAWMASTRLAMTVEDDALGPYSRHAKA